MSFTVLRVEVQQWEYAEIFLPVSGQSEEGVETDDVVEEEGRQEDCGHLVMRVVDIAMFFVFILRAEGDRILGTLPIDPSQSLTIIIKVIINTVWWWEWCVKFDRQVEIAKDVQCR